MGSIASFGDISRVLEKLSGYVPQVSIILGKCAAGSVYGPINTDVLIACSDKSTYFIRLCDAFNIPLVFVADTPGVLPGLAEEANGVIIRGGRVPDVTG